MTTNKEPYGCCEVPLIVAQALSSESDIEGRLDWSQLSEREPKGTSGELRLRNPGRLFSSLEVITVSSRPWFALRAPTLTKQRRAISMTCNPNTEILLRSPATPEVANLILLGLASR